MVVIWTEPSARAAPDWLRSLDFDVIWLDADRGAARPDGCRFVDPFEADGSYRPLAAVAAEMLSPVAAERRFADTASPLSPCSSRRARTRERRHVDQVGAARGPGVVQTANTSTDPTASGNIGSEAPLGCWQNLEYWRLALKSGDEASFSGKMGLGAS
jgi:hypothetical protein